MLFFHVKIRIFLYACDHACTDFFRFGTKTHFFARCRIDSTHARGMKIFKKEKIQRKK